MTLPLHKLVDSRYIPTKLIGSGGMADIYAANDTYCHKAVALKIIKDQFVDNDIEYERFKNEARFVSMFSHSHIIKIYNIGFYFEKMFISYELMNGKTLKDVLDERGRLSPEEAVEYMLQILSATKHIHERGVIHNDLKPDNLEKMADDNIKLIDFGIASHIGEDFSGKTVASISYAAPEVLSNKLYTVQSDIYSLGVILFELLTGKTPYRKENSQEEIKAHLLEEVPSISKYVSLRNYSDFDHVIKKATSHSLKQRYGNDDEFINDLTKIKKGDSLKKKSLLEIIFRK